MRSQTLLISLICSLLCLGPISPPVSARAEDPQGPHDARAPAALSKRIEQIVATAARDKKREVPTLDPDLSAAAVDLARLSTDDGPPPGSEIITEALHLHNVIEPAPQLILSSYGVGGEQSLMDGLKKRVPEILAEGHFSRLGVGLFPVSESRTRVLLLLLESYVELQPVPRSVPFIHGGAGEAKPVPVQGKILWPYAHPEVLVTDPRGQVSRLVVTLAQGAAPRDEATEPSRPLPGAGLAAPRTSLAAGQKPAQAPAATPFSAEFRCTERGRFQVEVLGENRYGATVLANFPLYCGDSPPTTLTAGKEAPEQPFRDAAQAEEQLFSMLQADRARFGLPKLSLDPRLAEVARAHSKDMRDHGFLGHVSPRSGDAGDRVHKAGLAPPVLLENLARAYSPREAERALMDSPGHRANLLNKEVSQVGIGVQIGQLPGGVRELWVTQLFARPAEIFDPRRAPHQALARVQELRKEAGRPPLREDAALTRLALQTVTRLADGSLPEDRLGEPAQAAMGEMSRRFRVLRPVLALTTDVEHLGPSPALLDPDLTHVGLAVAPMHKEAGKEVHRDKDAAPPGKPVQLRVYVVIVLAQAK